MAVKGGKMKDLIITICHSTRKVKFNRDFIGLNGENLQGNIVLDFTDKTKFVDGSAIFEVVQNGQKYAIEMTKKAEDKTYTLPIKSSLLAYAGTMECQVTILQDETEDGVPVFKTEIFKLPCHNSINATETIPEQYPSWVEKTAEKIVELDERVSSLEENGGGASVEVDKTLTVEGAAADAKAVGEKLDTKLDKAKPNNFTQVYVCDYLGNNTTIAMISTQGTLYAGRIPSYLSANAPADTSNYIAHLITSEPTKPLHCANKNYVDDNTKVYEHNIVCEFTDSETGHVAVATLTIPSKSAIAFTKEQVSAYLLAKNGLVNASVIIWDGASKTYLECVGALLIYDNTRFTIVSCYMADDYIEISTTDITTVTDNVIDTSTI